jgi:hypothetical protein
MFRSAGARAHARMERMRREDCPGCRVDTQTHRQCASRNDPSVDHGLDNFALCKHAPAEAVNRAEKQRTQARYDRLVRAGVHDTEILRLVPPAVHTVRPPIAWFVDVFDGNAHDQACGFVEDLATTRKHPGTMLLMSGRPGCGKSVLAAWALALIDRSGVWLPASTLEDGERWRADRSRALAGAFVVVDDLGRERDGWAVEAMKSMLTDLLDNSIPTIVTTNLSPAQITTRYGTDPDADHMTGTRLLARLAQKAHVIGCGNENLRAYAKAKPSHAKG